MGWLSNTPTTTRHRAVPADFKPAAATQIPADPLEAALHLGRYGAVARAAGLRHDHPAHQKVLQAALAAIDERFALVPEGSTSIAQRVNDEPGGPEQDYHTGAILLARHAVTNADYQLFVDAGGYQEHALWPEAVWAYLIDFRDQSGAPGPRYWYEGRHDRRLARHPVVGISWYEAAVYAAWAGYRLPTEPEWQVTATWQIGTAAPGARRFPWGDALDLERCNIWASGHGGTLPVDACPGGAAPNGVLQLTGNVWEWMDSDFMCSDDEDRQIVGAAPLKGIRGGAFDTYFAWQTTSTFRSGLPCLAREHNVGLRCALDPLPNGV